MSRCLSLIVQIDPVLQCVSLLSCGIAARLCGPYSVMACPFHASLGDLHTVDQLREGVTTILRTGTDGQSQKRWTASQPDTETE